MVKRQKPLTKSDMDELQSRIILAENLPEDHSHQNLMKIFASMGRVKSIRTCPPQNWNGVLSASRTGKGDGLNIIGKLHAFVEYESAEVAEGAVIALNDDGTWISGLRARLLLKSAVKSTHSRTKKVVLEGQIPVTKDELAEMGFKENTFEGPLQQSDAPSNGLQFEDIPNNHSHKKGCNSAMVCGGKAKEKGQPRGRHHSSQNGGVILGAPPLEVSACPEKLSAGKASPVPRMPDGTKGFCMGRGKPFAIKTS